MFHSSMGLRHLRHELGAGAPILGCLLLLLLWPHPGPALLLLGLAVVLWALGLRRLSRSGQGKWVGLLLVAALLRLAVLPLPPILSTDVWRYLWDGRVLNAEKNPYTLAPESPELEELRDELWQNLDHREVPTVYPPFSLGLFSIAARAPHPLLVWKLFVTAADLALCACLLSLARIRGSSPACVGWYAWNPLVVLEGSGMGHLEPLAVLPVGIVVLLLVRRPGRAVFLASLAAAIGVMAKLGPLAAVPMWARQSRRPMVFTLLVATFCGVAFLPLMRGAPGLATYAVSWEFNGPLYEPLWRWFDWIGADRAVKSLLDDVKSLTGVHEALNPIYPFVYPRLLAKMILAAAAFVLVVRSLSWRKPVEGAGALFGGLLLTAATLYPWYLLWVLPWAALARHRAWIALSASSLLCYLPLVYDVPYFPWVYLAVWAPFFVLLWRSRWRTD